MPWWRLGATIFAVAAEQGKRMHNTTTAEIANHRNVLTPGRYVGAEDVEDDGEAFADKMPRLVAELHAQFIESARLEQAIKANLKGLGYDR